MEEELDQWGENRVTQITKWKVRIKFERDFVIFVLSAQAMSYIQCFKRSNKI